MGVGTALLGRILTDPLELLEGQVASHRELQAVPENADDDVVKSHKEYETDKKDVPACSVCGARQHFRHHLRRGGGTQKLSVIAI